MNLKPLETVRFKLRRFHAGDLQHMLKLEGDREVTKFIPVRVPQSESVIKERLQNVIAKEGERSPLGIWAAEFKADSEFAGWFMLLKTDLTFPELGLMIPRSQWRKGIAEEVSRRLIQYALDLGHDGVSARTDSDHSASKELLKKIGFKEVARAIKEDLVLEKTVELTVFELRRK